MNFPEIYLASASPRRSELLEQIAVHFSKRTADIDETVLQGESPTEYVERLAVTKAKAIWQTLGNDEARPVLGADTSVVVDNEILGKPRDLEHAGSMIRRLSGRQHQVFTAIAVVYQEKVLTAISSSTVTFIELTEVQIEWYLSTGEGSDKAGGYAVQGLAAMFIQQIAGSYSGIMGLPLQQTAELLEQIGK